MFSTVITGAVFGVDSYLLRVETDISDGLPGISMVGSISSSVREAGDRIRVALKNSGIRIPPARITVNFSPADLPKRGTIIDLPTAAGILSCMGIMKQKALERVMIVGELSLDGDVKPVRGILPMVTLAAKSGEIDLCILPKENAVEGGVAAALYPNIRIIGVKNLQEMIRYMNADQKGRDALILPTTADLQKLIQNNRDVNEYLDFADVHGQSGAKRAMMIAAAGFHNILMIGPPGSGKSMLAKCLPGILPPLELKESLEVSAVYSIAGWLKPGEPLISQRPFLSPHHSISCQALIGGGRDPLPGIISMAHRGVLFLDELPEFDKATLNMLREPLEEHSISISRVGGSCVYPARFLLVAAANPCPCGYYPSQKCRCTESAVLNYRKKIPGPILDRIDLMADAPKVSISALMSTHKEEPSESIRQKVMEARDRQKIRFRGTELAFNGDMSASDVEKYCTLGRSEQRFVKELYRGLDLSARVYHKILRVARTIADLEGSEEITVDHLAEAAAYRTTQYGKEEEKNE